MKNTVVYLIAASFLTLSSCGSESEEAENATPSDVKLVNRKDSLSYAFGIEYANSIYANQNLKQSLDKEMAIKGFESNINETYPEACENVLKQLMGPYGQDFNTAYVKEGSECIGKIIGYGFYNEMKGLNKIEEFNISLLKKGFSDFLLNKKLAITEAQKKGLLDIFTSKVNGEIKAKNDVIKTENETLSASMMAEAKKIKGAQVFDNGIVIQELKPGIGGSPVASDDVQIEYILKNAKGETIQNSYEMKKMDPKQQPIAMNLAQVIPGWTFGLQKMKKGGKYKIFIPAEMAYGDQAPAEIGPGAALLFEIELLNFGKAGSLAAPMPQAPANVGGGF
jgi:FKBP-type peptidyl-prolyl cis-trans isomerase FkpA/FKBP-type peptidyl-prolyl cis-trans isomerase FklB